VSSAKSRTPSRSSSRETERLTAAGVTEAAAAAAVKLPCSAARQNSSMLPSITSSNCRFMASWSMDSLIHYIMYL
jgi:hypothetical protein